MDLCYSLSVSDPSRAEQSQDVPIEILPTQIDIVNNTQRRDALLGGREIVPLGETDDRFRQVVFLEEAFDEMIAFGMVDRSLERGGALIGFHCGNQTIITGFLGSQIVEGTSGTINFTSDEWIDLSRRSDTLNRQNGTNDEIMAWFHTHPVDYPPSPLTTGDREIMSRRFDISDKQSPDDRSTIIMTTYTGDPRATVAVWKWKSDEQSALLVSGVAIASKNRRAFAQSTYYSPKETGARVVKPIRETVEIDLTDLDQDTGVIGLQQSGFSVTQSQGADEISIQIVDETGETVTIKLEDLDPALPDFQLSLDDITPDRAKTLIGALNRNPDGPGNKVIRAILKVAKIVQPPDVRSAIDLVLLQTKPTSERIEIIE